MLAGKNRFQKTLESQTGPQDWKKVEVSEDLNVIFILQRFRGVGVGQPRHVGRASPATFQLKKNTLYFSPFPSPFFLTSEKYFPSQIISSSSLSVFLLLQKNMLSSLFFYFFLLLRKNNISILVAIESYTVLSRKELNCWISQKRFITGAAKSDLFYDVLSWPSCTSISTWTPQFVHEHLHLDPCTAATSQKVTAFFREI